MAGLVSGHDVRPRLGVRMLFDQVGESLFSAYNWRPSLCASARSFLRIFELTWAANFSRA